VITRARFEGSDRAAKDRDAARSIDVAREVTIGSFAKKFAPRSPRFRLTELF